MIQLVVNQLSGEGLVDVREWLTIRKRWLNINHAMMVVLTLLQFNAPIITYNITSRLCTRLQVLTSFL